MNREEQDLIRGLFGRLGEVEQRASVPRDPEAESFIREQIAAQPGAPYYMAQTIIVQEQALEAARQRITELERAAERPQAGGLLGAIFGGGRTSVPPAGARANARADAAGAARAAQTGGGGFLAGAAQTAVGVAGGVMLGNMLAGIFTADDAQAAETGAETGADDYAVDDSAGSGFGDGGFDFGGEDF